MDVQLKEEWYKRRSSYSEPISYALTIDNQLPSSKPIKTPKGASKTKPPSITSDHTSTMRPRSLLLSVADRKRLSCRKAERRRLWFCCRRCVRMLFIVIIIVQLSVLMAPVSHLSRGLADAVERKSVASKQYKAASFDLKTATNILMNKERNKCRLNSKDIGSSNVTLISSAALQLPLNQRSDADEATKQRKITSQASNNIDSNFFYHHHDNQSANQSNSSSARRQRANATVHLTRRTHSSPVLGRRQPRPSASKSISLADKSSNKCNSTASLWDPNICSIGAQETNREPNVAYGPLETFVGQTRSQVVLDGKARTTLIDVSLVPGGARVKRSPRRQEAHVSPVSEEEPATRVEADDEGSVTGVAEASRNDDGPSAAAADAASVASAIVVDDADDEDDSLNEVGAKRSGGGRSAIAANRAAFGSNTNLATNQPELNILTYGAHGGDQIRTHHNLIEPEDDDLFLVKGSRVPMSFREEQRYHKRRSTGDTMQRQTIYFGGFFPWLTDELGSSSDSSSIGASSSHKSASNKHNIASTILPMINGNQELHEQNGFELSGEKQIVPRNKQHQYQQYENQMLQTSTSLKNRHQLGRFILPAVRLALDHININNSVLNSYKLEIVPRDTQCNATISLKEFFDMVYEEPKKMLLYGDACRVSTDPIAKASYFFDLIQISYADTDPIYTIENYPNFFRVVPSENALSLARIPFIRHFNWTGVGTIYQNLPRYSLPHSKLLTDLEKFKIVIKQSVSLPGSVDGLQNRDLGDELRKLKEKDVRIILGNFDEEWALLLFCEAFRERMTGRKYQWILTGVSEDKLWRYYKSKGSPCSEQELLIAMDGYIITDITPVTRSQQRTISGMIAHEYSNEYKRRAQEMNISIDENKFYGYVYDGIWAIALALQQVDYKLKYYNRLAAAGKAKLDPAIRGLHSLLDFDYHKPIWVKLIRNALNRTRFDGVTGTVTFHKNERPGLISFSQFQAFRGMSEVIIGSYDALNDNLDLKVGFPIFWRGPSPPIDYTIQRVTPFRINRTLFVIISILALFGIVLAFVFLTINIKFRNQRYIKMSSPYLNNLIIIGCILTYTSVIILGLDSGLTSELNFPYICNARAWVLMAGFTLAFGSMFSKTFRVHSIFTNIKLHKKVIKDYKLFMVVFILLTFDVCILIVWQYFDPFYRETNNGTSIQDSDNEDVIIVPEMEHCQSKRMTIFLSVIYVYKGLLMAFGCFLAWETRHVSIPALNDSKYIGLSVYNVVIMCVIGASLSFVLRDQQDASFVIISIFIIFCSTTTLCLVFVPKLFELKQNPRAGEHRVRATLKTFKKNYREEALGAAACRDIHGNIIGRGLSVNLNERIRILLEENVKQRTSLKEKTYELEALTYKYRKIQSMIQSGQYLQASNTTAAAAASANLHQSDNLVASSLKNTSTNSRPVSFSIMNDDKSNLLDSKDLNQTLTNNKFGLIKSPLMSSATQITTTNTTSSTNNATDMTTDYSSCKMMSNPTTSTDGSNFNSNRQGKRAFVAFDCPLGSSKQHSSIKQTTLESNGPTDKQVLSNNYANNLINSSQKHQYIDTSTGGPKKIQVARACRLSKQSPKYTTDSFYCSPGVDYELSECRKSQDDLDLFTVFSYISNSKRESRARKRLSRKEQAENSFNRWSEGPFCTLMLKNSNKGDTAAGIIAPGRVIKQNAIKEDSITNHEYQSDDTRASCPNIGPMKPNERNQLCKPKRQLSEQANESNRLETSTSNIHRSYRLPRTISMIEYLGLSEFDMIARRHDRLMRRKAAKKQLSCCYERAVYSCCQIERRGRVKYDQHRGCQMHSESDMAFSSNDPLNSTELLPTSSRLSCSTCCSLASQTYASQSDVFDETTRSSQTISSQTVTSSGSESMMQPKYLSNSRLSTRSSSDADQETTQSTRFCHLHNPHLFDIHHAHHHQSSEHISYSSSTSSLSQNQETKLASNDKHSLCTSGLLYCPSSTKEGANESGQLAQPLEISDQADNSTNPIEELDTEDDEQKRNFSIKCDVLESL